MIKYLKFSDARSRVDPDAENELIEVEDVDGSLGVTFKELSSSLIAFFNIEVVFSTRSLSDIIAAQNGDDE